MSIFNEFFKKEKPVFTGIARGLGGFGFGGGGASSGAPVTVSGGTTIDDTTHWINVFTVSGSPQTYTLTADSPISAEILMVGGGGAGGCNADAPPAYGGGGGGAGGMISESSYTIVPGPHAVTVGAGGPANPESSGTPSTFVNDGTTVIAYGGGRGAAYQNHKAQSGGSGGGANPYEGTDNVGSGNRQTGVDAPGGTPIPPFPGISGPQGNDGGSSSAPKGGGGGGASEAGHNPSSPSPAAGGAGSGVGWIPPSYGTPGPVGSLRYFAGGGGGGDYSPTGSGGSGGTGGGGDGGTRNAGSAGADHTGGGGGGVGSPDPNVPGHPGGPGIVAIRVPKTI